MYDVLWRYPRSIFSAETLPDSCYRLSLYDV